MSDQSPPTQSTTDSLRPGFVVGGRFEVLRQVERGEVANAWSARDTKTDKPIRLDLLKPGIIPASASTDLKKACKEASVLSHRNIVRTFGVGKTPRGELFVAGEAADGSSLTTLIAERARHTGPMSLRGAYNVIAHLCSALSYAEPTMCHGTVRPSAVRVTKAGRVKLHDFGVGKVVLANAGPRAFGDNDHACLAPEVKSGSEPTLQSDVFGLGAVLYQLLTARSPADDFVPPSHVRDDVNVSIDEVLLRCLSVNPADRFENAGAVRSALMPHLTEANSQPPLVDTGISVDIDLGSIAPPPDVVASMFPPSVKDPAVAKLFGNGAPAVTPDTSAPDAKQAPDQPVSVSRKDLEQQLEALSSKTGAHWMIAHDKMDHGPFRARELVERLVRGHFSSNALTMNIATGERKPLGEWPEFKEFALQRAHEEVLDAEDAARTHASSSDKRRSTVKLVAGASLLALLGFVGFFVISNLREAEAREQAAAKLDDLYELGDVRIKGEAGILAAPKNTKRRRTKRAPRPGPAGASYEYAMSQAVEIGDATRGGGEGTLSGGQVAKVMNANVNRLYKRCVVAEKRSGGTLTSVRIDLAIAGNGSVLGSSVRDGSPVFRRCVAGAVRKIRFPTFGAPRMGAQYRFRVDR